MPRQKQRCCFSLDCKVLLKKKFSVSVLVFCSALWGCLCPIIRFGSRNSAVEFRGATSYFIVDKEIRDYSGRLRVSDEASGRISGEKIFFDNGILSIGTRELSLTGTYDSSVQQEISLEEGNTIELPSGSVDKEIKVKPDSTASIVGAPILTKPITLEGSTSELRVGLQSQLSQDVNLNGGTLVLDDNLSLQAGKQFVGGGTIDVNGRTLTLPKGEASTGKISFISANDVALSGNLIDSVEYYFAGVGGTSEVNGNGYIWKFFSGGFVSVGPTHELFFTNAFFKEFGNQPTHGYLDIDVTSTVILQGCTISLSGDYTHDQGTLEFRDGCRIVHHGHKINTTGLAFVRVDGASLFYDSLGGIDQNPFTFTDADSQRQYVNGGAIRSSAGNPSMLIDTTTATINFDHKLSSQSVIYVPNPAPASPRAVEASFSGHSVIFPGSGTALFNLDPNVNLTISNVELFEYNKDTLTLGDANASLAFGTGTKIRLFDSEIISGSDKSWSFVGDGLISGTGTSLVLDGSSRITVDSSSTLVLKDLRVTIKTADALKALDSGSKIIFENCDLTVESAGFEIAMGNVDVKGRLRIFGGDPSDSDVESPVTFSSTGIFKVCCGALLRLGKNVNFEYKADPSNDSGLTYNTKRHFILEDATATLELDGCTLRSTQTGLALDYGRVVVSDRTEFIIDGSNGTEAEIGSALDVYIKPSMAFVVTGTLAYNATTMP